ncbi:MAG: hypothetical protein WA771_15475 [Chthoniobacterales bacterium]
MSEANELFKLLLSPLGMGALALAAAWFFLAGSYPILMWIGLGVTMYAASLQKFYDPFLESEWYPFLAPIETLVQSGRPLSILCLGALVGASIVQGRWRGDLRPPAIMVPIHAIQVVLLGKMLMGAVSVSFVIQAALVYGLVATLGVVGVRSWLIGENSLRGPATALCTAVALFCLLVEWQLRVDPTAAILNNGRLIGTCGNPQHAAVLLAACLPGPLYFLAGGTSAGWRTKAGCVILLLSMLHLLVLTGSRTGAAMCAIIFLLFFRRRIILLGCIGFVGFLAYSVIFPSPENTSAFQNSAESLLRLEDTRSHVWAAQWRTFLEHPVIGPPIVGERLGFGENSWLALLATAGTAGLACLAWLLTLVVSSIARLVRYQLAVEHPLAHVDFCLAGLIALFAGSFLEAYLLGIITLPILAILTYSAAADRFLEHTKEERSTPRPRKSAESVYSDVS